MDEFDKRTEGEKERRLIQVLMEKNKPIEEVEKYYLPFPVKIQIQTQSFCNGSCPFCPWPYTSKKLPQGKMDEDLFMKIIEEMKGKGMERISLFLMNEPLLDKRLEKFVEFTKKTVPEAKTIIFTNGILLTKERYITLKESGLDEINISIPAFGDSAFKKAMGGLSFNRLIENLEGIKTLPKDLKKDTFIITLDFPGHRENAEKMEKRYGIKAMVKPVTNRAGNVEKDKLEGGRKEERIEPYPCQRPFVKAYVIYNGDMILCNCDWMREVIIGNLKENSLSDLWMNETLMRVRRHHYMRSFPEDLPCSRCDYPYIIER